MDNGEGSGHHVLHHGRTDPCSVNTFSCTCLAQCTEEIMCVGLIAPPVMIDSMICSTRKQRIHFKVKKKYIQLLASTVTI